MVHFRREKYVPRGGPDGGDGGRGGDIILKVNPKMNTLNYFRRNNRFQASDGRNGGPSNMTGRSANPCIIKVPPGTIVHDSSDGRIIGDLTLADQELLVCRGGRGGRGNIHFATSRNQVPRTAERGEPGREVILRLELKIIADVGIVGIPNAGKSSLLAALTHARPKIADYPFTTLEPNLGVMEFNQETTIVFADIPGLIEGAHKGSGLGDSFLRHIQRTRVLVHLLDGESDDPLADYSQINNEMALFDKRLLSKTQLVALNKIDLPDTRERYGQLKPLFKQKGVFLYAISAYTREGLDTFVGKIAEALNNSPQIEQIAVLPLYQPEEDPSKFTLERMPQGWIIRGRAIERAAAMTYWEHEGSLRRFQRLMETIGVDDALRTAGAKNGDTVFIGDDYELEYQE